MKKMNVRFWRRIVRTGLGLALLLALGSRPAAGAVSLTVTPDSVSNSYAGVVTLQIGGLNVGETVVVEQFLDADANGTIDKPDVLLSGFQLTDGQSSVIGGVTNINVVADTTPADGAITAPLNFSSAFVLQKVTGQYLFRLSSPTSRFPSITKPFTVTSPVYGQSFAGSVRSGGANVPYAMVLAFPGQIGNTSPIAGVMANGAGGYSIQLPPGTYGLSAFLPSYLSDFGAPALTLGAGGTVNTNLNLLATTQTIKGRVFDAGNSSIGLPGLFIMAQSDNNLFTLAYTDAGGNFTLGVTPDVWGVNAQGDTLASYGYIGANDSTNIDTTGGSVLGVSLAVPKATALIYGYIKDDQNHPLPGVQLYPNDDSHQYEGRATTDRNGYYVAGVLAGLWHLEADNESPGYGSYVFTRADVPTTIGQAVRQDLVGKLGTHQISGSVKDNSNHPVVNVGVWGNTSINGTNYHQWTETDANGYYSFSVANGDWTVGVECNDGDQDLTMLGYQCVDNQNVPIANNNGTASFTVYPINNGPWWSGASDLGNGWKWLNGFGYFSTAFDPWIYHQQHGWLYGIGNDLRSVFFWDNGMQAWWWTSAGTYPYLYRFSDNAWLWYQKDSVAPRWFYNITAAKWESL